MSIFSTNQNRHMYVVKNYAAEVTEASAVGTIGNVKVIDDGFNKILVFKYKGVDGVQMSDRIQLKNLDYAKSFKVADLRTPLKSVVVKLDSTINSGNPIAGEDYVLRIEFRQFYGMSDENQYFKDAAVHATAAMAASPLVFYQAMVASLNMSFAREVGANSTSNPYLKFEASANGITITEKEQDWALGTLKQERVYFDVVPTTIFYNSDDVIWGTVEDTTPAKYVEDTDSSSSTYQQMIPNSAIVVGTNAIGNGKAIADLEWFCMGERGDQYRYMGYPNYIPTQYLVDPTHEYNVLELHHAFTDTGVNSYRSEKDITIVADTAAKLDSFIGAVNTAAGLNIALTAS